MRVIGATVSVHSLGEWMSIGGVMGVTVLEKGTPYNQANAKGGIVECRIANGSAGF